MGQRGSKTLTFSFLLVLLAMGGLFFLSYQKLSEQTILDTQHALGTFSLADDLDEATVVSAFESALDQEKLAEGQRLEKKYGYAFQDTRQQRNLERFVLQMGLILLISSLLLLLIWGIDRRRQQQLQSKVLNVSERFEEEQRRNAVLLARRKSEEESVKATITDITHQLKTPIASLKMSMEIAGSETFSAEERKMFWEQGGHQIDKLDLMLDSMSKLSRLEAELISLQQEAVSMQEVVTQVVGGLIMKALDKEMEIEVDITEDRLIFVDRKWTIEAIGNVLENAIKYAPEKTIITVRGTILPSYVLIEVMDEGAGIPQEDINLIYRRFYRGSDPRILDNEGSGVGLYLTRKIIEEQGGVVLMKNRQPCGANFQLTVPLVQNRTMTETNC